MTQNNLISPLFNLNVIRQKKYKIEFFSFKRNEWSGFWSILDGIQGIKVYHSFSRIKSGLSFVKKVYLKPTALGMLELITFPITVSEFIVHIWKIILVKQKGVCALCCQYCEGWGDYKAN